MNLNMFIVEKLSRNEETLEHSSKFKSRNTNSNFTSNTHSLSNEKFSRLLYGSSKGMNLYDRFSYTFE